MKKILYALLLSAILALFASTALANVAKVGDTEYATFGAALDAAISGTNKTVTIIGEVPGYSFTKNIDGITIQGSSTGKVTGMMNVTGSNASFTGTTFKNIKFEGGALILSTAAKSYKNLTITGCEFIGPGPSGASAAIQVQKTTAIPVDGLKITNNKISNYSGSAILLNGGGGTDATVSVENNSIENVTGNAVQALNIKQLNIEGNTVNGSGNVFNLYGTQNATIADNDVTLGSGTKYVIIYVSGKVDFDDNTVKDSTGNEIELTDQNCHSEDWTDTDNLIAIDGTKNNSGDYVSGRFVGSSDAVKNVLADNVEYVGDNGAFLVGSSIPATKPVSSNMPQTGDHSQLLLWGFMLAMSCTVFAFLRKRAF